MSENTNTSIENPQSEREVFTDVKPLYPKEIEPLDEKLWKDLQPEEIELWSPADDIYLINKGMNNFTEALQRLEDPESPLSKILTKLQNNELLTEAEQARVQRTDNMFTATLESIQREKDLQERYAQSLTAEDQKIASLEEKEQNGSIADEERAKLTLLRQHVLEGAEFLKEQKEITEAKQAAIQNSKWRKGKSI